MAFREVRVFEVRELLRLWLAGEGIRATERLVGFDRKTVRRYVDAAVGLGLVRDAGDQAAWLAASLADIEHAGQQELLNWFTAMGAVQELGLSLEWSTFVETHCFNSNKVFAIWR